MPTSPGSPQSELPQAAGLFRRLAAMLYDSLLVAGLLMFATLLVILVGSAFVGEGVQAVPSAGLAGGAFKLFLGLIIVGFFSLFWVRSGRTLGMQAWGLRIEDQKGGPINIRQSLVRILGAIISAACFGLGYLWVLFDADRLAWHDRLSGTRIRWTPKNKKTRKR